MLDEKRNLLEAADIFTKENDVRFFVGDGFVEVTTDTVYYLYFRSRQPSISQHIF